MKFPIEQRFKLSDGFIEKYKSIKPKWGFGGLGEFVYMRTYSRLKLDGKNEAWFETVRRVVEGIYSIQKQHIEDYRLGWNQPKAQKSAQEMYDRIFNFKMLPPGRSLWAMGSDIVMVRGLTESLYNCSFLSTKNIAENPGLPFANAMDFLMLGVGVGFDVQGAGKISVEEQKEKIHVHQISDDREGWVKSIEMCINSFFGGNRYEFDYSIIRPEGTPIKTFGGISAGYLPLKELHDGIVKVLFENVGSLITKRSIADIINMIGKAVVSGNVRRSAEIILGDNSEEFLNLKNYEKNPERMEHGWASNNSVYAELGMDYSEIAERIKDNAEPGLMWKQNAQKFGRMRDSEANWKDARVEGLNPCVSGDTLVAVADGRKEVSFKVLAEEGKDVPVYSIGKDGIVKIKTMRNPRLTGYNKIIYGVLLDNGSLLKVTGNHKFILRDGNEVEAKNLKAGDSLRIMSRVSQNLRENIKKEDKEYYSINSNGHDESEHRMIASYYNNNSIPNKMVVHHIDGNGKNNLPENLEILTISEHNTRHKENSFGENNGKYSGYTNDEIKKQAIILTGSLGRRFSKMDWVKYAKEIGMPIQFSEWREKNLGSLFGLAKWAALELGYERVDCDPRILKNLKSNLEQGYDCYLNDENNLIFRKQCEFCEEEFESENKENSFCSTACFSKSIWDKSRNFIMERMSASNEKRKNKLRELQVEIYIKMEKSLGREPMLKEWKKECFKNGVSSEISRKSSPFRYFSELKNSASLYNHKVVSITIIGKENVYNGTVDDFHNYAIGGFKEKTFKNKSEKTVFVFTLNCGEITLEPSEMCNLCELFPNNHEDFEDYKKTIKYAYLFAKSVTLLNTNWSETNKVMLRNRRIGLSITGTVQFIAKHGMAKLKNWMEEGYKLVQAYDQTYSEWFAVPLSKKTTTHKPSGTISLLAGATPGIHFPESQYYIRRVRLAKNSPYIEILKNANYNIEPDNADKKNTLVVEFPVFVGENVKTINDVTMWEQLNLAAFCQENWADNSVSVTVTFKDFEKEQIKSALDLFQFKLKAVSFLPKLEKGAYKQMPYEEITKEKYEKMSKPLLDLDFSNMFSTESVGEMYCESDVCMVL